MRRRLWVGASVIAAVAAVSAVIGLSGQQTGDATAQGDPEKAIVVSKAAAIDSVAAFAGVSASKLSASNPVDGKYDRFYLITGPTLSATVDVHDGSVTTLVLDGIVVLNAGAAATHDNALSTAREYLDSHAVGHQGMTETIEVIDHGESTEYLFTWQRYVDGVIVPDIRQVGIDAASGQVFRFHNISRPYEPPAQPTIPRSDAIEAAREASFLGDQARVRNVELRVEFDATGRQYLAWNVYLDGPVAEQQEGQHLEAHFLIEVDAATGEARIVGQS